MPASCGRAAAQHEQARQHGSASERDEQQVGVERLLPCRGRDSSYGRWRADRRLARCGCGCPRCARLHAGSRGGATRHGGGAWRCCGCRAGRRRNSRGPGGSSRGTSSSRGCGLHDEAGLHLGVETAVVAVGACSGGRERPGLTLAELRRVESRRTGHRGDVVGSGVLIGSCTCWPGEVSRWPFCRCSQKVSAAAVASDVAPNDGLSSSWRSTVCVRTYRSVFSASATCWLGDASRCPFWTWVQKGVAVALARSVVQEASAGAPGLLLPSAPGRPDPGSPDSVELPAAAWPSACEAEADPVPTRDVPVACRSPVGLPAPAADPPGPGFEALKGMAPSKERAASGQCPIRTGFGNDFSQRAAGAREVLEAGTR